MRRLQPEPESSDRQPEVTSVPAHAVAFRHRRMVAADLEAMLRIEAQAFPNPWSAELFLRELTHDWSTILLAEEPRPDGTHPLAGFIIYWLIHDEIHILNVAVDPAQRRRGIARGLLSDCLSQCHARGGRLATLEVRRSNDAAIGLYSSFGFRKVAVRRNYYEDEGEDALVMNLDMP